MRGHYLKTIQFFLKTSLNRAGVDVVLYRTPMEKYVLGSTISSLPASFRDGGKWIIYVT